MEGQISMYGYGSYKEYREELRKELAGQAGSFVRTGYLLRLAQDTDILEESGYGDVLEFAFREFGLDRSQVSRYVNINRAYSEGGYSDRLKEQYRDYGYAKLALMLTLPEGIREELGPEYTKSEIQAVKEEIEEEKKVSDLELLMETGNERAGNERPEKENSMLDKTLYRLMGENPDLYREIYRTADETIPGPDLEKALAEVLAPYGSRIYTVRIQGEGRYMLSVKGAEEPVTLMNVRNPEHKEKYSWKEMENAVWKLMGDNPEYTMEETWESLYGEPYPQEKPEKPEATGNTGEGKKIAPVQQKKKKNSRVVKSALSRKEPEDKGNTEMEDQIPGQDSILNHTEYMPQEMIGEKPEVAPVQLSGEMVPAAAVEEDDEDTEKKRNGNCRKQTGSQKKPGNPGTDSESGEETAPEETEASGEAGEKQIWMEVRASGRMLEEYMKRWKNQEELMEDDVLEDIYRHAIELAAELEKIKIIRRRQNGEKHTP